MSIYLETALATAIRTKDHRETLVLALGGAVTMSDPRRTETAGERLIRKVRLVVAAHGARQ